MQKCVNLCAWCASTELRAAQPTRTHVNTNASERAHRNILLRSASQALAATSYAPGVCLAFSCFEIYVMTMVFWWSFRKEKTKNRSVHIWSVRPFSSCPCCTIFIDVLQYAGEDTWKGVRSRCLLAESIAAVGAFTWPPLLCCLKFVGVSAGCIMK